MGSVHSGRASAVSFSRGGSLLPIRKDAGLFTQPNAVNVLHIPSSPPPAPSKNSSSTTAVQILPPIEGISHPYSRGFLGVNRTVERSHHAFYGF